MKKFMTVMAGFMLVFSLAAPSRAANIYDLSVSGSFSGTGHIEFSTTSGSSVGQVTSFSFTVDTQTAPEPSSPCQAGCAPLPITFGLSDIQSISWSIDTNDSSLSFELETFTKVVPDNGSSFEYDVSFDTAAPIDPSTTCGRPFFPRVETASFCTAGSGRALVVGETLVATTGATFEEIISNSVAPEVLFDVIMLADFRPNSGTVSEAAAAGGYDHFNWLSIVVKDDLLAFPFNRIFIEALNDLRDQNGDLPIVPYFDPPHGGYQNQLEECGVSSFPVRDDLDWYWDERFSDTCIDTTINPDVKTILESRTSSVALEFQDSPETILGFDLEFETYLVGVREDGTGDKLADLFPDSGTNFRWAVDGHPFSPDDVLIRENTDPSRVGGGSFRFLGFVELDDLTPAVLEFLADRSIGIRSHELVTIDIKPGSDENPINRKSQGVIPVAILSTIDFDAPSEIDESSLTFGPTGDEDSFAFCDIFAKDVNSDEMDDLVCYFYTQDAGFSSDDSGGILKGQEGSGTPIIGGSSVRILH